MSNIEIGTQYLKRGDKQKHIRTVVDKLTTTNLKGDIVHIRYVTTHEFCGQLVKERDVVATTILMGKLC